MSIREQIATLYRKPDEFDQVMRDHYQAEVCCEVEAAIGVGVLAFRILRQRHRVWSDGFSSGKVQYSFDKAKEIADRYAKWKEVTECWLPLVAKFENLGYEVEHAESLRECHDELSKVDLDLDGVAASYRELETGGGLELGEFLNGLPSEDRDRCG